MLNHSIILAIAEDLANRQDVGNYAAILEDYLNSSDTVPDADYYTAQDHLSQCYNYLTKLEQKKQDTDKDPYPSSFTRKLAVSKPEFEEKIRSIAYESYTEEQLESILLYLSREVNCSSYELRKYYEAVKHTEDREEFLSTTKLELEQIIRLEAARIDITDFLPNPIANEILDYADKLKVYPEACLTALITALSVCMKIGTQLEIQPSQGFVVNPYLFSMIVADSGSMKSPILKTFAKKPIENLQRSFVEQHKVKYAEYEERISEWDSTAKDDRFFNFPEGKPKVPDRPRVIYFGDKSMEAIYAQFDRYPDQALLYMKDEIAGLFYDADKYKSGKGSESQDLMSMFDGTAPPVMRKDGGLISASEQVGLAIFGTIQPEILEEFWSSVIDPDGYWSRFLYCYQAKSLKQLTKEREGSNSRLPQLLNRLFERVHNLQPVSYRLDEPAYLAYAGFYDYLAAKSYLEVHPAIAKAYSKALGVTGRLILNLHIINQLARENNCVPNPEIGIETVKQGINLMQFYLNQRLLLNKKLCNQESISPQLKAVIDLSKRLGWITSRDVKRNIWYLRDKSANEIRSWFLELINLEYGIVEGKGNRIKFLANS